MWQTERTLLPHPNVSHCVRCCGRCHASEGNHAVIDLTFCHSFFVRLHHGGLRSATAEPVVLVLIQNLVAGCGLSSNAHNIVRRSCARRLNGLRRFIVETAQNLWSPKRRELCWLDDSLPAFRRFAPYSSAEYLIHYNLHRCLCTDGIRGRRVSMFHILFQNFLHVLFRY